MFRPVQMVKISVLVLDKYMDPLAVALGDAGFVHLIDASTQSRQHLLAEVDLRDETGDIERLLEKCVSLADVLGLPAPDLGRQFGKPRVERQAMAQLLDEAYQTYLQEDEAINALVSQSGTLVREAETLDNYPFRNVQLSHLRNLNFLYFSTGRLPPTQLVNLAAALGDRAMVMHEADPQRGDERVLIFAARKDRWSIESELAKTTFKEEDALAEVDGSVTDRLGAVSGKLAAVHQAVAQHQQALLGLSDRYGEQIAGIHAQLKQELALNRAKAHFGRTANLYCVSGWLPAERQPQVTRLIEDVSNGTALIEFTGASDDAFVQEGREQVPVQFPQVAALRPFQRLIASFGAPRYQEVEPSLFVALSFVLMFGLMFGDVGQGAVIALAGAWLVKTRKPVSQSLREAGFLLIFCGLAAVAFGLLYGSVFGHEHLLPKLWVRPLDDVMKLFQLAIAVGIICISVGIIINIVNRLRARDYFKGVFDKFGIIGILFYWGSIGLGLKALVAGRIAGIEIIVVMIIPLAILFIREPLYNLMTHKKHLLDEDPISFAMGSAIEVMETVTTFLGSTVSFVRIGAFALSHAALCLAIYAIVEALQDAPLGGLWSLLVIVVGNLFVILLEGLVVTIQGIRLQYYELFSKYFAGDGVLYQPFELTDSAQQGKEMGQ